MKSNMFNILFIGTPEDPVDFQEKCFPLVKAISPVLCITDGTDLFLREQSGDKSAGKKLDAILAAIDAYLSYLPPPNLIARAPRLKWIASPMANVDSFLIPEIIDSPVVLTNSRVHATQVSEAAFMHMMMLAKKAPEFMAHNRERLWERFFPGLLRGKIVGILGLGSIGREFARMCKAFGMNVVGIKAHRVDKLDHVDLLLPPHGLSQLLSASDFVVIMLPLTRETENMIGREQLVMMKPTAYLINVGRGAIVNEDALVEALRNKGIAGAGLDVFTHEPLPSNSELWTLPNVIITPHFGGSREDNFELVMELYCENVKRFIHGKELLSIVNKAKGY